jgi:hypothetical protein
MTWPPARCWRGLRFIGVHVLLVGSCLARLFRGLALLTRADPATSGGAARRVHRDHAQPTAQDGTPQLDDDPDLDHRAQRGREHRSAPARRSSPSIRSRRTRHPRCAESARAELIHLPGGHYAPFLDGHEQAVAGELAFLRRHLHENLVASRSDPAPAAERSSRLCSPARPKTSDAAAKRRRLRRAASRDHGHGVHGGQQGLPLGLRVASG